MIVRSRLYRFTIPFNATLFRCGFTFVCAYLLAYLLFIDTHSLPIMLWALHFIQGAARGQGCVEDLHVPYSMRICLSI
jgi:hypothetical protein